MQAQRLAQALAPPAAARQHQQHQQQPPARQAVLSRAAAQPASPTSLNVSLGGPGKAAEARTDSASGTSTSGLSTSPDSVKAFLQGELPRIFTQGVRAACAPA